MDVDKMKSDTIESLNSDIPGAVNFLQIMLFIQFGVSFGISILTTIGISFGYEISSYYLLTLLQIILAIPGMIYLITQGSVFIALYVTFEIVTAICEIFWLIFMLFDGQTVGKWVALMLMTTLQIFAIIVAIFFRDAKIKCGSGKKSEKSEKSKKKNVKKPELRNASHSLAESRSGRKKSRKNKKKENEVSRSPTISSESNSVPTGEIS